VAERVKRFKPLSHILCFRIYLPKELVIAQLGKGFKINYQVSSNELPNNS